MRPPPMLDELLSLGLGVEWPLSDQAGLRTAGSAWSRAVAGLDQVTAELRLAAGRARAALGGGPREAFDARWRRLDGGPLRTLRDGCDRLGAACTTMATEVDAAEAEFAATVSISAAAIVAQFAAGFLDFGITDATAVAELGTLRGALQEIVTTLVERIGATQAKLLTDVVLSGLTGLTKDTANQLIELDHGLRRTFDAHQAATAAATSTATAIGASALRTATGPVATRLGFDPARIHALNDAPIYRAATTALAQGGAEAADGRTPTASDLLSTFTQSMTSAHMEGALGAKQPPNQPPEGALARR